MSPNEKANLAEKIANPRLKTLALRLLGRHFRSALSNEQEQAFLEYLSQESIYDYQGNLRLSVKKALEDIETLRKESLTQEQIEILDELAEYLSPKMTSHQRTGYI